MIHCRYGLKIESEVKFIGLVNGNFKTRQFINDAVSERGQIRFIGLGINTLVETRRSACVNDVCCCNVMQTYECEWQ